MKINGLVWLIVLTAAVSGQVKDQKKTPPSAQAHPESPEHKFARAAWEEMSANAAGILAVHAKLKATEICQLVAEMERQHLKLEGITCQLSEAEVNAVVAEYCTTQARPCDLRIHELLDMIGNGVDAANSKIGTLGARLEHADTCAAAYRATIDKRASDFTVRQTDQIKTCKDLDQYPPKK